MHTDKAPYPAKLWISLVFATVAVAVRCAPALGKTPDSHLFLSLAANLMQNFCYSTSTVITHLCIPTWGQQPPGYPIFIALTQWLTFSNERVVVVTQTIVFAAAAIYFARWLFAWHRSPILFHASVVIAMLSPITIGWSRVILSELLTSASTMWVLTELLRSLLQKRVRIWSLGLSLAAAMLMRWDQICLLGPAVLALWLALGWRTSLRPLIAVIAISAIPYFALMARAALVGLPLLPSPIVSPPLADGGESYLPPGIITFYRVAALDVRATGLIWNIFGRSYDQIQSNEFEEYTSRVDRKVLGRLFARLRELPTGTAVPKPLDEDFVSIARDLSEQWFPTQLFVPLIRAGRLWQGWIGHNIAFSSLGLHGTVHVIFVIYSLAVIAGVLISAIAGTNPLRYLSLFAVALTIVRTSFLVSVPISALENRYLDELFPAFDMIAFCAFWVLVRQHVCVSSR